MFTFFNNSQELASCIVLERQCLIIVDSSCMDMQIRKQLFVYLCIHSVWKACLVTPLTSAHCGYWLPLAAPLSATTVEVTIKDYVMFQIVFATLHQAGLSTGGVKCYTLKLYHPPQYMVNMI